MSAAKGWRESLRRFGREILRTDAKCSTRFLRHFADPLEQRILLATDLSPALITAVKNNYNAIFNTVDAVHDRIFTNVLARSLPLVGQALNVLDQPADLLNAISSSIRTKVGELVPQAEFSSDDIKQKIFDANLPGITDLSQIQKFLNSNNEVEYLVPLSGTLVNLSTDPTFSLGLPGLGLSVTDGTVDVNLTYNFNLKLGFNTTDLVYIDLGATDEVQLQLVVTTPGLTLNGNIALLKMTAANTDLPLNPGDRKTKPTHFTGTFGLDFTDGPDAGSKLTIGEIGSMGLTPTLTGSTDLNLKLNVDFGSGKFPSFEAYLNVGWDFANSPASVSTPAGSFGGVPMVSFNNVAVDLGSFLSKMASPIITEVNKVLKPVRPIMDILYDDIPALTTINRYMIRPPGPQLDVNTDGKVTLRDLLELQTGQSLRFLDQFQTFLAIFPDVPEFTGNYKVPLGSFDLTQNQLNGGGTIDVRTLANLANVNLANFSGANAVQAIKDFATGNGLGDVLEFAENIGNETLKKQVGDVGEGLKFPIIEQPESALTLFLGQSPILFYFDMNPIVYNVPLLLSIRPPAFPFVSAGLRGSLGDNFALKFRAKFAFGYDTFGLTSFAANPSQPGRLLDGFYVSDRANPDGTGADDPEVRLDLGIELFGSAGVPFVAELVLGGGPQANILANLKDANNDGRVRLSEISDALGEGPLCVFDISGELKTVFRIVLETPLKDIELSSTEYTLLSFTLDCGLGPNEPVLANYDANTETLYLNMGPRSGDRLHGDLNDIDEKFYIKHIAERPDGSEIVEINAFGLSQTYGGAGGGVRHIVGYGGAGNDEIALDQNVTSSADFWGDFNPAIHPGMTAFGNDRLVSGIGPGTLHGGDGDDELFARAGGVTLLGEAGHDRIFGSPGNDTIDGGDGNDTIFGDLGNDTLVGGADNDYIYGFEGDDSLDGGAGHDILFGETGNDTLVGADGNDQLLGSDGNDSLDGGAGNDILEGEAGNDTLLGGANNDTLIGGADADSLLAGSGDDIAAGDDATVNDPIGSGISLTGGDANDTVHGDEGNDLIYGQDGSDSLRGGTGLDTIHGGGGHDSMQGDADADLIFGDLGDDTARGGSGNDTLYGFDGLDHLFGDDDDDHILGELGNDSIEGGLGNDSILGSSGLDTIHGQDGNDTILGGTHNDLIFGNAGADSIAGEAGDDSIEGGTGNDTITGDDGNDTLHGQDNDDVISGGNNEDFITGGLGNDAIDGNSGNDSIQGNAGDDTISGLAGRDSIRGDAGHDSISGGDDEDFIRAGTGNDSIDGGAANDILHGEDGNDLISGNTGADRIDAGMGNDTAYGFAVAGADDNAADTITGRDGNDSLIGGGGPDFIDGGAGTDTLAGNDGNDTLLAGSGIGDSILGGMGHDHIVGSDDGADTDPNFGDAIYFGDIIDAGAGNDTITALGGADLIMGGTGNDWIDSGTGGDSVSGGEGDDFIYAGQNGATGDNIAGLAGSDTIWGSAVDDTISGGDDNDSILAQDGTDSVTGDSGDDIIDTGAGNNDFASGGAGNDQITDSGGAGNTLHGDSGNDTLTGSNDGSDSITGGSERDRIYGRAGNDTLSGGSEADTIYGNEGDDLIAGDEGADILVGGEHHDTIYGHSASGAGDDNAQDTLYGDLGTNGNEANSGRDQLFGQGGNDFHYGEGDLDSISGGGGAGNLISYAPGGSTTPEAYAAPAPTAPPTIQPAPAELTLAGSTLPAGADYRGRWTELASSASNSGLSNSNAIAIEPSIVIASDGAKYVAWADGRRGNYEIYVAKYTLANGWEQLAGSAGEGGLSATLTSSRRPSITIGGDGNPIVAWTETNGTSSDIRVARFDGANWTAMGTSLGADGISVTGVADRAIVLNTAGGPIVTWLNGSNVHARLFTAGSWQEFGGIGSASGDGISANPSGVFEYSAATDGTKLAVTWAANDGAGIRQIYLREFDGAAWNALAGSFAGSGLSNTSGESASPSAAYHGGSVFVSWQDNTSGLNEIHTARFNGAAWVSVGGSFNTSNTQGDATAPHLAGSAGGLWLVWNDDTAVSSAGAGISIYAIKWNGSSFVPDLSIDNTGPGVQSTRGLADIAVAVNAAGQPSIAWDDSASITEQVLVRSNDFAITGIFNAGGATSVQSVLDANALGSGSVILVSGNSAGFTVSAADAGVSIIGMPGATISGAVTIDGASVTIQGLTISGTLTVSGAAFTARDSSLSAVQINGAADAQIVHCSTGLITLSGGATGSVIEHNSAVAGITLGSGGAADLTLRYNMINAMVSLANASTGTIRQNRINAAGTGLSITAAFTGIIEDNDITGSIGVLYSAAATLSGNRIFGSATGVSSTVSGGNGFGFVGSNEPNQIYSNTIGVTLTNASMQNQHVYSNTTGVSGSGALGPSTHDLANLIELNTTGVNFSGTVRYNRIARNAVGILANSNQLISHNIIWNNTQYGVRASGKSNVRLFSNTLYTNIGDNVRLDTISSDVQIINNIFWSEGGYSINVAADSRGGFFSDYNLLHSAGAGKLVSWLKDFTDIFDWQSDLAEFDLHSIGTTIIHPDRSDPGFINRHWDDFQTWALTGGQRNSAVIVDAGTSIADQGADIVRTNLLTNPSFDSGVASWTTNAGGATQSSNPSPWEGSSYFFPGSVALGFAEQTINLVTAGYSAGQLDSQDFVLTFGGRVRSVGESMQLVLTFLDGSNATISTVNLQSRNPSDRWELLGDRRAIPVGTRSVKFRFESNRQSGTPNDSYLDSAFVHVESENNAPDLGAFGHTPVDGAQIAPPHVAVRNPDLYTDLILTQPIDIQWDSFGNTGDSSVRIDVYQDTADGPQFLLNITPGTSDTGHFTWIPLSSGLSAGVSGLRIQVSLSADNISIDRSTEASTVPQAGGNFYVDDSSNTDDEHTPAAIGSNRNTGKLATSPKPLLTTLARIYDLDPAQTVHVDTGAYQHFKTLTISGVNSIGNDEGVTITGPTDIGKIAQISPLGFTSGALIDIDQGDFTTLSHLKLNAGTQYGILIRNNSTNNTATYITQSGATIDGINADATSAPVTLDRLDVSNNGQNGVFVQGTFGGVTNSRAYNNPQVGIRATNTGGAAVFTNNETFGNGTGISVGNLGAAAAVIGNADLSLGLGNRAYNNTSFGIFASGNAQISGNVAYGHSGSGDAGIRAVNLIAVSNNIVYGNNTGIWGGTITANRVYGNSLGVFQSNAGNESPGPVTLNSIYSNGIGYRIDLAPNAASSDGPVFLNNLVYASTSHGVIVNGGRNATIYSNTIYQTGGDAIQVNPLSGNANIRVRNNVLHVGGSGGYAINAALGSQSAVTSDFNLFYITGSAKTGFWSGGGRTTLSDWRSASGQDVKSISGDPLYVDPDGTDDQLGFIGGTDFGADDNFHERSPNGSFKGGTFAPILSTETGLPVAQTGSYSNDAAPASPVIDRGDEAFAFASEPAPNGGFINLGAYGNTSQASKSEAQYTLVLIPNGGETVVAGQNFNITWRQENLGSGTVAIELMHQAPGGALTLETSIAAAAPNTGSFTWAVPELTPIASDYVIRVTRSDAPVTSDISDATFSVATATPFFYVNDSTVAPGDFTTQPGNDANDGLTPATPKASIQAILNAYDLGPGDVIKVDRGVYNLTTNITIENQDSGVAIVGFKGTDQSDQWSASVLADAPTHYYRLGESSGTTAVDSSGFGSDATYENNVTLGDNGALKNDANTAAGFGGTGARVRLPNGFSSFPNGFSYEGWIYPAINGSSQMLFDLGNGPGNNNLLLYRSGDGSSLTFQVYNGQGSLTAASALTQYEWQHIAVTMTSAGAAKIYRNGQLLAAGNVSLAANVTRTQNFLGRSDWTAFQHFAGGMDEAAFYDKVLSEAQISGRYALASGVTAVINRGNTAVGAAGIDLSNADNVTISDMSITGAYYGIRANDSADSDNLTLTGNKIYGNFAYGLYVGSTNDALSITQNEIHGNFGGFGANGVSLNSVVGATITDNDLYGNTRYQVEIAGNSVNNLVSFNRIYGGVIGVLGGSAGNVTPNVISNNDVHDIHGTGINVSGSFIVESNTVHDIRTSTGMGISAGTGVIRDNVVYNNITGIQNGSPITGNRVFNNSANGIVVFGGGVVENNQSYGNGTGIFGSAPTNSSNGPFLRSNLVYQNVTTGIRLDGGRFGEIINNTIYQPTGTGIALNANIGTFNDTISNNIVVVGSGTGLALANTTHTGLVLDYNDVYITGGGNFGSYGAVNYPTRADWYFDLGFDEHSLSVDPQFVDFDGADNLLGYVGGEDHGADDDFSVLSGSLTIDAGNPASYYLREPQPNGARINLGHQGNTPDAVNSALKSVQVLSPNGLEKLTVGVATPVLFATSGLGLTTPVMLMNAGGTTTGPWLASAYSTNASFTQSVANTIDTTLVSNPAPQQVYQQYLLGVFGINQTLNFQIPVSDGSYTMRLHFIEPVQTSAGTRVMDVKVNGAVLTSNYDPFVAAGNMRFRATTLTHSVSAAGGTGLALDLVSKVSNYPLISGIEITAATPAGSAAPTVNIDVSLNNGANWSPIASDVALDVYGQGSFLWTPDQPSDEALIRVTDAASPGFDVSNDTFLIGGSGGDFYVNDNSTAGDFFTTAIGNDSNNGKSPDKPMRTLAALIGAYTFQPGDTIHVDTGAYTLSATLNLGDSANNVTIEGPPTGSGIALINRSNTGTPGIRFDGADNVTIRRLSVTGAQYGLFAEFNANFPSALSNNITIDDCDIYGNSTYGIYFQGNASGSFITNNRMHTNGFGSINIGQANGITIDNNTLYNSNRGAQAAGAGIFITNNEIYGNSNGIEATGSSAANLATVQNNIVRNNSNGIIVQSADVVGNTVFGHTASSALGISSAGGKVRDNVVYGNGRGIYNASGLVTGNRVYNNTNAGIEAAAATVSGNFVYNNTTGIIGVGTFTTEIIRNNLVYANTSYGIRVPDAYTPQILGNTVYQPTGDGIRIEGTRVGTTKLIRSNIVQVNSGSGLWLGNETLSDTTSDYNTIFTTGTGKFGTAAGRVFTSREQWFFETRQDRNSLTADPLFIDIDGADNLLGYVGGLDRGLDDNFGVQPGSPTVDNGDPSVFAFNEPAPNGGRINQGHTGNTALAVPSAGQTVQILSPNGLEKLEAGNTHTIRWGSGGLLDTQTLGLLNVGTRPNGTGLGDWQQGDAYAVVAPNGSWVSTAINTAGVVNPGPQDMYQSYSNANSGVGNLISYKLSLADGTYTLRLHWQESFVGAGQRQFDIRINGAVVQTDFDVYAAAGNQLYKAVTLSLPVTAIGGNGVLLELVNKTANPAFLCGVDITAANPLGQANPTATLEYSTNNGGSWNPIASGLAMDLLGRGNYDWTVPATLSDQVLVRVTADQGTQPTDTSNTALQIVNNGTDYYVNDASVSGDVFSSAIGDNLNSGKSADQPMASIYALLQDYSLDSGDVIHVDAGTYSLIRNITLFADDSGVVIQGPTGAATATLDRGTQSIQYTNVFQFLGADNVTIERLSMLHGYSGIEFGLFNAPADSDNNLIRENDISQMGNYGVFMFTASEDNNSISDNTIHDISAGVGYGVYAVGAGTSISGNEIFNIGGYGILIQAVNGVVSGNTLFGNRNGIFINGNNPLVSGNTVRNSTEIGIIAGPYPTAVVIGNTVFANATGITSTGTPITSNRVFANSGHGIDVTGNGTEVRGNQIYSNATGLRLGSSYGYAYSNIIYANTTRAISVDSSGGGTRIWNNTVYSIVGDAVRLTNSSNVSIHNNILWTNAGSAIFVNDATSQSGLSSDHNLFNGTGSAGTWSGVVRTTLGAWQAASAKDANSLSGDPLFVDLDGADNILGYRTLPTPLDGGGDDNFFVAANSPAIDRGHSWNATRLDFDSGTRVDDPGTSNAGSSDYFPTDSGSNQFTATGTAKNWRNANTYFGPQALGFSFPFFGTNYTQAYVGTNGILHLGTVPPFGSPLFDADNSLARLTSGGALIAPLWDAIKTNGAGDDIFVDTSIANQITLRWNASRQADNADVQFAVVLFSDGSMRFDYGPGNTNLSPTIGIASGAQAYHLAQHDGQATLTGANSIAWSIAAGITDIGALEFRGTSLDTTAPVVASTTPTIVHAGGSSATGPDQIVLNFNEALNRIDATAPGHYDLRAAGPDTNFDTGDDIIYTLAPAYIDGTTQVTLELPGELPSGTYRLTLRSNPADNTGLHDRAGILLDGDANASAGGNYVRVFSIAIDAAPPTIVGTPTFNFNAPQQSITVQFSEDVSAGLGAAALEIANVLTPGSPIPTANIQLQNYDGNTHTATFTFSGFPNNALPDGNYTARFIASEIRDAANTPMSADVSFPFFFLNGDATRDRIVDTQDFNVFVASFGMTGRNFSQSNFNYDNIVDSLDFNIFVSQYGKKLNPPAGPALASSTTGMGEALFSDGAVDSDDEDAVV